MKVRTIEHGDGVAVVFDRKTLAEAGIVVGTEVTVTAIAGSLVVKASDADHRRRVREVTRRVVKENAAVLRRLAD